MSPRAKVKDLKAAADYYRDRVSLRRAKLYRWGLGSDARLQALERQLQRAQRRLRDAAGSALENPRGIETSDRANDKGGPPRSPSAMGTAPEIVAAEGEAGGGTARGAGPEQG